MKLTTALLTAAAFAVAASRIHAQTLNWGNEVFGDLTDSEGAALDNTFVFELGSFVGGFVPTSSNLEQWVLNWEVFDRAAYQENLGYFTSTVYVNNDVTTSNPTASTMSFAGLDAYIWIRNQDDPAEGAEWLLTRAADWTFPTVGGDCCDTRVIEWAVSDLEPGDVPVWGRQNGVLGSGEFSSAGTAGLQTFTFVPEPSSAVLAAIAAGFMLLRRRRIHP
jgi:hypothetical protein